MVVQHDHLFAIVAARALLPSSRPFSVGNTSVLQSLQRDALTARANTGFDCRALQITLINATILTSDPAGVARFALPYCEPATLDGKEETLMRIRRCG